MTLNRRRIGVAVAALVAAAGVTWYYFNTPEAETAMGIVVYAEDYDARIDKALDMIDTATLSQEGAEQVSHLIQDGQRVLTDLPDKLEGLPAGVTAEKLDEQTEISELLRGLDEEAAADALIEANVKLIILHSRVAPSVDRGAKVLSKLYHHDELRRFKLLRVSDGLFTYRVIQNPVKFEAKKAGLVFNYVRSRLSGIPTRPMEDLPSENGSWTFMVVVRAQGKELAVGFGHDQKIQTALNEAVTRVEANHRRTAEILGFPRLKDHMEDLTIEIHRITERTVMEVRDPEFLKEFWELGVDGAYMYTADKSQRGYLPGAAAYTRTLRSADSFLRHAAQAGRMQEKRPWRDPAAYLEVVRGIHWKEFKGPNDDRFLVQLERGVAPVPMETVNIESVKHSIVHSGDWYMANLQSDGRVVYKFWPAENRMSNEYNLVRHTLATWNLVQAYEMDPTRTEFLEGSRRALDYTQRYLKTETVPGGTETMAYYSYKDNQKLGTVVVNILGMVALAEVTEDHQWDEQLKQMGRFVLFMQEESGTFDGYYVEEGHPYYGQKNDIVPGEAALALITLADYFEDDFWISTLDRYWSYYKPWWRERVEKRVEGAPWPTHTYSNEDRLELVQFGPWTVMAAYAYYHRTGDLDVADFGLEIARWMLETYQWDEDRAPFKDFIGGYYKMPHELPAMQAFCYAEGTAAAYRIALEARPEQAEYFGERTRQTVRFGLQVQLNEFNTYSFSRPEQVDGGTPYAMNETKVRIDYVHHALSAMYQWVLAAEQDAGLVEDAKQSLLLPHQNLRNYRRDMDVDDDKDGTPKARDCDDSNPAAYNPNASEICDGMDNNCNGEVDEGLSCPTAILKSGDNASSGEGVVKTQTPAVAAPEGQKE